MHYLGKHTLLASCHWLTLWNGIQRSFPGSYHNQDITLLRLFCPKYYKCYQRTSFMAYQALVKSYDSLYVVLKSDKTTALLWKMSSVAFGGLHHMSSMSSRITANLTEFAQQFFRLTTKKTQTLRITGPLCWESADSNGEKWSMPCCTHGFHLRKKTSVDKRHVGCVHLCTGLNIAK